MLDKTLQNLLGTPIQTGGAVTATSGTILPDRQENVRNRAIIQNTGTGTLWLAFGGVAIAGKCLFLAPNQSLVLEAGDNYSGLISGVSDTTTTYAATEFLQ